METDNSMLKSTPLTIAGMIIIIGAVMYAELLINPLLMAFFIFIICSPAIGWLKKKRVPDSLAILLVILLIFTFYAIFIQLISTSLALFVEEAPKYQQGLNEQLISSRAFLDKIGFDLALLGQEGSMDPSRIMQFTTRVFSSLSEILSQEITFIFLTIFLLTEVDSISLKMQLLAKNSSYSLEYINNIGNSIRHYLSIKTLTSLITGVLVAIFLALIGVDFPVLWGLVAFLLNYIPTVGSIIAAIPATIISIIELGFPASFLTIGVYVAINLVIGNIIEPRIMGRGLGLSTFVVFFSLLFWGFILGYVGMFLSVPITMVIKIMLENNPKTKWIAALLGVQKDAEALLNDNISRPV
jgi:AI-2 transport protein TqsA